MADQQLSDVQQTIDALFRRLDDAKTGGEITQCNHSLRVQITRKRKLGGALSGRERDLIAAVGEIAAPRKKGGLGTVVLIVAVLGVLYLAYRYFSQHA
jgi:hypothetical protein